MKKLIIILLCIIFACSSAAFANEKDTTITPIAKNIVHVEFSGIVFDKIYTFFISINYERIFLKWFSIRFGYGYSNNENYYLIIQRDDGNLHGMNTMINFHTTGNKKFNFGVGVSFIDNIDRKFGWYFFPSLCITYRYQPIKGGVYFSIGSTIAFGTFGISIGIGRVF